MNNDNFKRIKFSDCDLSDTFFDTLKEDYKGFENWFKKKCNEDEKVYILKTGENIQAFVYIKLEKADDPNNEIICNKVPLPKRNRIKIGTFKISKEGERYGEGAIGLALWYWQLCKERPEEIYFTTFEKQKSLIQLAEKFGFVKLGYNENNELVMLRNRKNIDFSNPYKSFPFISSDISEFGMLPIDDKYHDTLFQYSELKNTRKENFASVSSNGLTKVFIGFPKSDIAIKKGMPLLIYRIYKQDQKQDKISKPTYKSAITSYCVTIRKEIIKSNSRIHKTFEDFLALTGNKTLFNEKELYNFYTTKKNLVVLELLYYGYLGKGNNVIHKWLNSNNLFSAHPYNICYNKENFINILEKGNQDVSNIIINQP